MTTKVLVSAEVLGKLIAAKPEVEMELVGSAVAQIAGRIAHKVSEKLPSISSEIDKAFTAQLAGIKSNVRLHPEVKQLIRGFIDTECKAAVEAALKIEVTQQALARVNDLVKARLLKVDEEIATAIRAGRETVEREIRKMAADEFLKLVRGAAAVGSAG